MKLKILNSIHNCDVYVCVESLERNLEEQERLKQLYEHERLKTKALEQQLRDFVKHSK